MAALRTAYYKDIRSYLLKPAERQEQKLRASHKGEVCIRIASDLPVSVDLTGPHIESTEVRGTKEFKFSIEPDTEFYVATQNKARGFLAKPVNVTLEIEMSGSKKAIDVLEKAKSYLATLTEMPDFYDLQKDAVKELIKESMEVWTTLGGQGKATIKELMDLIKKLEAKPS